MTTRRTRACRASLLLMLTAVCFAPGGARAQEAAPVGELIEIQPRPLAQKKKKAPKTAAAKRIKPGVSGVSLARTLSTQPSRKPVPGDMAEKPPLAAKPEAPVSAPKDEAARPAASAEAKAEPRSPSPDVNRAPVSGRSSAQDYCVNVAGAASQALVAWQAKRLAEVEEQIKQRIEELEAKRAEFQQWFAKQDEARRKTEEGVVAIFSKMRPDAAALQLAAMDEASAAAILARLNPRVAGAVLNEMTAAKAARLTDTMTRVALAVRNP